MYSGLVSQRQILPTTAKSTVIVISQEESKQPAEPRFDSSGFGRYSSADEPSGRHNAV